MPVASSTHSQESEVFLDMRGVAVTFAGGNFRLLPQIERVLSVNDLHLLSSAVVEAARDSLVIGPA
jgi:hypothetical protein